jgi:hypothetical protein
MGASKRSGLRAASFKAAKVPKRRLCGTMQVHYRLLERFPEIATRLADLEHYSADRRAMAHAKAGPVVIQVVVHVVYKADAENISDAQVKSQISALNRDYRARNKDKKKVPTVWAGLVTDAGIQFALATKDPHGKPTNGITRTKTNTESFSDDDRVKFTKQGGVNAWPSDKYLNLWVCTLGGGLLGYAQFPNGPVDTDGVVILNTAFGTKGTARKPFNLGRTATHEVGHWLNLRHIWGDTTDCSGGDSVDDTPNAATPNYGKPAFPHITCKNGPNGDMFMNYMDYVDDGAMVMFTTQQVARMHAALTGARGSIAAPAARKAARARR